MPPTRAIEAIIQDAMARGEFDNLPGAGKPLDLSAYFDTPEEVRLAYSILKNADVLPREAELLKEVAAFKEELESTTDEGKRKRLRKAIEERLLKYRLLVERKR
jgi:DNA-binding response OmpR family regulator